MTDGQVLDLMDRMEGAPRLTIGSSRYVLVDELLLVWHRKGTGGRWTWSPGSGTHRLDQVPAHYRCFRELRTWLARARIDFAGHARAMGARTL